jgi:hypothetical protein
MLSPPLEETTRLTRLSRLILFALTVFGSLVMLAVFAAAPAFSRMFMDYGSDLPTVTKMVLQGRYLYLFAGVAPGAISYVLLYGRNATRSAIQWIVAIILVEFALFIIAASALFMPILQLAAPSAGT